ncbi:hypothetical protein CAPTEDRAFT_193484 [Capitella teleta]|uniref:Farnesoic acid O-methyl transferase domain-containing protein n=1 Tax=Capitella teleta TaxID=283909 RepID=R7TU75_CAPTE|nr:hypothetical protein CAPTEDRAFT_193484 [Capitella teleta]|eukprot:ELT97147.1 hypothetical protein CAPTEDRAFT_193484 [Capitella teleta]
MYPGFEKTYRDKCPSCISDEEVSFDASFLEGERLYQQAWVTVREHTHLRFGLTSCGYAELILSAAAYNTEFDYYYKLEIQTEHNHTLLWLNTRRVAVWSTTHDLLSCTEERPFWLSWHSGSIAFGQGHEIGQSVILSYQDLNGFPVAAVGLATRGNNTIWRLALNRGSGLVSLADSTKLSDSTIAGIVMGTLLALVLIGLLVYLVLSPPVSTYPVTEAAQVSVASSVTLQEAAASQEETPSSFENIAFEEVDC